jgi:BolA protein
MTAVNRIELLHTRLNQALSPQHLEIIDDSHQHAGHAGARNGGHFQAIIVSAGFAGKTPVQRHRLVFAAIDDLMNTEVHALSLQAFTPEEYAANALAAGPA